MSRLTLLLFLLPVFSSAQTHYQELSNIRYQYSHVESRLDSCKVTTLVDWVDVGQYDGAVPVIKGYFDEDAGGFIKITETVEGDWMERTTSYYLMEGEVFFVLAKGYSAEEMYTAEELGMTEEQLWESGGEAKTVYAYEQRGYFSKGAAIQLLTKSMVFPASQDEFDLDEVNNKELSHGGEASYINITNHIRKMGFALRSK